MEIGLEALSLQPHHIKLILDCFTVWNQIKSYGVGDWISPLYSDEKLSWAIYTLIPHQALKFSHILELLTTEELQALVIVDLGRLEKKTWVTAGWIRGNARDLLRLSARNIDDLIGLLTAILRD